MSYFGLHIEYRSVLGGFFGDNLNFARMGVGNWGIFGWNIFRIGKINDKI